MGNYEQKGHASWQFSMFNTQHGDPHIETPNGAWDDFITFGRVGLCEVFGIDPGAPPVR